MYGRINIHRKSWVIQAPCEWKLNEEYFRSKGMRDYSLGRRLEMKWFLFRATHNLVIYLSAFFNYTEEFG